MLRTSSAILALALSLAACGDDDVIIGDSGVGDTGTDSGEDSGSTLATTLTIAEVNADSDPVTTGCVTYDGSNLGFGATTFAVSSQVVNRACVLTIFEGTSTFDSSFPGLYVIASTDWFLEVEGLTRFGSAVQMRDPSNALSTASDNITSPGTYTFNLFAEDAGGNKQGGLLAAATLEVVSFNASTREMSVRLTIN